MLVVIGVVVAMNEAERRIPVQYAKRMVGRKMYGGQSTFLPIKLNMSGVMPIIFASSIVSLVPTILALCGVTAFTCNALLNRIFPAANTDSILNSGTFAMIISVGVAGIVYLIALLLFKGIAKEDVSVLPKGEKIAKVLEKYGLLG